MIIQNFAKETNYSVKQIRRLILAGHIKAKKEGGIWKINYDAAINFIEKNKKLKTNKVEIKKSIFKDAADFNFAKEYKLVDISKKMLTASTWETKKFNKLKYADVFSGAGGLSLGFLMAGFKPVASLEIQKDAVATYEKNIIRKFNLPHNQIECRDIRDKKVKKEFINYLKKQNISVLMGGFPCTGFSMAGNRIICDPRNSLYLDLLDIAKKVKPKYLVMENVKGLLSMMKGKVLNKIINDFVKIGYNISYKVLNSADYGVAQTRQRVILIGTLKNKEILFPKPIYKEKNYKTLGQEIKRFIKWSNKPEKNHLITNHSKEMQNKLMKVPEGKSLYANYSDGWKKSPWNKPSCTIKENHGGVNIHPKLPRVLTPRELAALQSFPDNFIFQGPKSQQLKQIGNAVPPVMARAIAETIKKMEQKND